MAFVTTETHGEISAKNAKAGKLVSVFLPTTPNPTTGFLQIVPEDRLVQTGYTVEEGIKMVMSLGVLVPERGVPLGL